ncbi:MAG: hypothetical protein JNJ73_21580 [Hyphomonadaceae bacterium]|nr:hypothetical protein [Hyphomonadaceae bacterium]
MKKPHYERRSRGEIDRNFLFGDIFIKTGGATALVIGAIALYTPFTFADALAEQMYGYLGVMGAFGAAGAALFFYGRHLRAAATHWDLDQD